MSPRGIAEREFTGQDDCLEVQAVAGEGGGRADAEASSPSDREPSYGQRRPPTLSPAPGSAPSSLLLCCQERSLGVFPDTALAP